MKLIYKKIHKFVLKNNKKLILLLVVISLGVFYFLNQSFPPKGVACVGEYLNDVKELQTHDNTRSLSGSHPLFADSPGQYPEKKIIVTPYSFQNVTQFKCKYVNRPDERKYIRAFEVSGIDNEGHEFYMYDNLYSIQVSSSGAGGGHNFCYKRDGVTVASLSEGWVVSDSHSCNDALEIEKEWYDYIYHK